MDGEIVTEFWDLANMSMVTGTIITGDMLRSLLVSHSSYNRLSSKFLRLILCVLYSAFFTGQSGSPRSGSFRVRVSPHKGGYLRPKLDDVEEMRIRIHSPHAVWLGHILL